MVIRTCWSESPWQAFNISRIRTYAFEHCVMAVTGKRPRSEQEASKYVDGNVDSGVK